MLRLHKGVRRRPSWLSLKGEDVVAAEAAVQAAIVQHLRLVLPGTWLVQGTLNNPRNKVHGAQEVRKGLVAGFPDVTVWGQDRAGRPASWLLEIKAADGSTSDAQDSVHARLMALGHPVFVVRSIDDARAVGEFVGWPMREAR